MSSRTSSTLVCRHACSEVNLSATSGGAIAFNAPDSPLTQMGIKDAQLLGERLESEYGISRDTLAATSELRRTWETAQYAGLAVKIRDPNLNEVVLDTTPEKLQAIVCGRQKLPRDVLIAADRVLSEPPNARVIISSGLLIAGMCIQLGMNMDKFD